MLIISNIVLSSLSVSNSNGVNSNGFDVQECGMDFVFQTPTE